MTKYDGTLETVALWTYQHQPPRSLYRMAGFFVVLARCWRSNVTPGLLPRIRSTFAVWRIYGYGRHFSS